MKNEFYAHSREGKPPEDWHRLEDHLKEVAELLRTFANWDRRSLRGSVDWHCLGPENFALKIREISSKH